MAVFRGMLLADPPFSVGLEADLTLLRVAGRRSSL